MPSTKGPLNVSYLEVERQVFANLSLKPQARQLSLTKPLLGLRAVVVGLGEPVIFLHGFSLCTAHWAPLMSRLAGLHSIAIDMPGHGDSEAVDFGGVDLRAWFKEVLTSSLDELGVESAHIIGHSQGAMIGMWLALDAPERVRSLVAIGTPAVAFGAHLNQLRMLAMPGIGPVLMSMPARIPESLFGRMIAVDMGRHAVDAAPDLVHAAQLAQRRAGFGTTVSTYLREMFKGAASQPPRYVLSDDELATIQQPVLIVWGEEDHHYQSVAEAKSKAALIRAARFEVVPGGHEPWLDDLEQCADLISAFIGRSSPEGGVAGNHTMALAGSRTP
jgi:pimeloyl-ACP methyl ester carboxylesterase